jgi:hypothetical protein
VLEDQAVILVAAIMVGIALWRLLPAKKAPFRGVNLLRFAAEQPLCPQCVSPVGEGAGFCPTCQTPLSVGAVTSPLQTTFAEGELLRRGMRRPTTLAIVGLSLLALPHVASYFVSVERGSVWQIVPGAFLLASLVRTIVNRRRAMAAETGSAGD